MIWQPEFTDKTLSRKIGAVQIGCTPETLRVWVRQHDQHRELLWRWIFQRHVTVTEFHLAGTGTDSGLSGSG
ncbi:hypothetical protein E3L28_005262 [Escherichia coli]|nr:hypothetical protein [Escherichia coli]EEV3414148.1 hypothetical protein [Escherichia coli]EZD92283.1 hypothetical protein BX07_22715 [Escherichia coli O91:H14 str. 2009C-3227]